MNIRDYLFINSEPLLDDERNIIVLEWLEGQGNSTAKKIATSLNISECDTNKILQTLYKNTFITCEDNKYEIAPWGIDLLDSFGLSDFQINKVLVYTNFLDEEQKIYKEIFKTLRKDFLDIYLVIVTHLRKESNILAHYKFDAGLYMNHLSSNNKIDNNASETISYREFSTIFLSCFVYLTSSILYTDEKSNLISSYMSLINYCNDYNNMNRLSTKLFYSNTDLQCDSKTKLEKHITEIVKRILATSKSFKGNILPFALDDIHLLSIIQDLGKCNKAFQNRISLGLLANSSNVEEFAKVSGLSETQAKLAIKYLNVITNKLLF